MQDALEQYTHTRKHMQTHIHTHTCKHRDKFNRRGGRWNKKGRRGACGESGAAEGAGMCAGAAFTQHVCSRCVLNSRRPELPLLLLRFAAYLLQVCSAYKWMVFFNTIYKSFRDKPSTPLIFCFNGYGLTLNLSENKRFGEIRTKTCISTPVPPFWQANGTNPAPHSHP